MQAIVNIMSPSIICMALAAPFAAMSKKRVWWFCTYWIIFFLAQLLMYYPGSDVSPYAYSNANLEAIRFGGFTLSALSSIVITEYIILCLMVAHKIKGKDTAAFLLALIPNCFSLVLTDSVSTGVSSFLKMMLPFIISVFIGKTIHAGNVNMYRKTILATNIIIVGQVFLSKLIYGSFGAYNYYYELQDEFFGFYNHPHSFTSLLSVLVFFNIYEINKKRLIGLNLVLCGCSMIFMYMTGVRTYMVSLAAGLAWVGIAALHHSKMRRLRKYVYVVLICCLIVGPTLIQNLGSGRDYISADFSSGRFVRWISDAAYVVSQFSPAEKLFGRGVNAVYAINERIFGVSINSLNLFIDLLCDYGFVGGIMMLAAYWKIFQNNWSQGTKGFVGGFIVSFIVSAIINSPVSYVPTMSAMVAVLILMKTEEHTEAETLAKRIGNG